MIPTGAGPLNPVLAAVWVILSNVLFLYLGAILAGVKGTTIGKAFVAAIAVSIFQYLLSLGFTFLPAGLSWIEIGASVLGALLIIQISFGTNLARAVVVLLFHFVAQFVVTIGMNYYVHGKPPTLPWT